IAWAFLGEVPSLWRLAGYALIVGGLLTLVYGYVNATGAIDTVGSATLIGAAVLWALYTLRLRRTTLTPLQAAPFVSFSSAVFYLPFFFGLGLPTFGKASGGELLFQSFYQGVLMSVVAIYAFNRAVVSLGARAASAIIALIPVAATALAFPVLGELPPLISVS